MKVTKTATPFAPVTITLESQEEIDALYLISRSTYITSPFPSLTSLFDEMERHASPEAQGDEAFRKFDDYLTHKYSLKTPQTTASASVVPTLGTYW